MLIGVICGYSIAILMPAIYAVANQKGGVGKTTTAVSLAASLAEKGHPTLLIDLDPQANATSGVGVEKQEGGSIYHSLLGQDSILNKIVKTAFEDLYIVPSEMALCGVEIELAQSENFAVRLKEALVPLREQNEFKFVFIDSPPSLGVLTTNVFVGVDKLIIPMQCEYYSLEGLTLLSTVLQQIKETGLNPELEIEGILMTMFDSRTNHALQVLNDVRNHFGEKVYHTVIPRSVRLSEAPSFGKPIIHYDRSSSPAVAYRAFADEFLHRQEGTMKFMHSREN